MTNQELLENLGRLRTLRAMLRRMDRHDPDRERLRAEINQLAQVNRLEQGVALNITRYSPPPFWGLPVEFACLALVEVLGTDWGHNAASARIDYQHSGKLLAVLSVHAESAGVASAFEAEGFWVLQPDPPILVAEAEAERGDLERLVERSVRALASAVNLCREQRSPLRGL